MLEWKEIADCEVPAKPTGVWTRVCDYVEGVTRLKLEADGRWSYGEGRSCGPDGDLGSLIDTETCLMSGAPVGALIGKLGGSTAGRADGYVFVVGSSCVLEPGASEEIPKAGPLYLTVNDLPAGLADNSGTLHAKVFDGTRTGESAG